MAAARAGAVPCPPLDVEAGDSAELARSLVRVLDDSGEARGPWAGSVDSAGLERGLFDMKRLRAFDACMLRAHRQGKTSFYMQALGEEAIACAHRRALGVECLLGTVVRARTSDGVSVVSEGEGARDLVADAVLVAVGRRPVVEGFGLERLGAKRSGAFVAVDERCETSIPNVFAVGDLTGEPMLAHRAIAQARVVADVLAGESRTWDHRAVPAVCFTDPEIFSVGISARALEAGGDGRALVGQASFAANGRARTLAEALSDAVADALAKARAAA